MTQNNDLFWTRILELAQDRLKQATYEYFLSDARLIKIENQVAFIHLEPRKQNFWENNLNDIILTAGFEIFDTEISANYSFEEEPIRPITTSQRIPEQDTKPIANTVISPNNLNKKYRFENFIEGEGNRWTITGAMAAAEDPGTTYNPLFIWGGPGLGKTHLLNAIGNRVLENNPYSRIEYITTENFLNEFTTHIRLGTMEELKEKFRSLDVLLIDDVQFLSRKAVTQEEFFNTFNALYDNNKQIVLTSDRPPDEIDDLEERLVSRFSWGLTTDITPPDFETRVAILTSKIQEYPYTFPQTTIEYLANQFNSNVRDLEGALKNINLIASIKNIDTITVEVAAEAIRSKKISKVSKTVIPIEEIQEQVSQFYNISIKDIKSGKRQKDIALPRQIAMYLAREMTDNSLPKIGKAFGRDHSTVLHSFNKIRELIAQDESLRIEIDAIKNKIS